MACGWSHITNTRGQFTGAGLIGTGGDAEEMALAVFGMMWWLAAQLASQEVAEGPGMRPVALRWITTAAEHITEGAMLGGQAGSEPA